LRKRCSRKLFEREFALVLVRARSCGATGGTELAGLDLLAPVTLKRCVHVIYRLVRIGDRAENRILYPHQNSQQVEFSELQSVQVFCQVLVTRRLFFFNPLPLRYRLLQVIPNTNEPQRFPEIGIFPSSSLAMFSRALRTRAAPSCLRARGPATIAASRTVTTDAAQSSLEQPLPKVRYQLS